MWGEANHPSQLWNSTVPRIGECMRVKVLLADDAEVMRKAIRRLLSECEDIFACRRSRHVL